MDNYLFIDEGGENAYITETPPTASEIELASQGSMRIIRLADFHEMWAAGEWRPMDRATLKECNGETYHEVPRPPVGEDVMW